MDFDCKVALVLILALIMLAAHSDEVTFVDPPTNKPHREVCTNKWGVQVKSCLQPGAIRPLWDVA